MQSVISWFKKYFSNEQAVALVLTLAFIGLTVIYWGHIFAPLLIGIIIAYLLQQPINLLARHVSYSLATIIVFSFFIVTLVASLIMVLPACFIQLERLALDLPLIISNIQKALKEVMLSFSDTVSVDTLEKSTMMIGHSTNTVTGEFIRILFKIIPSAFNVAICAVLIPMIVFFINKDKDYLLDLVGMIYPNKRSNLILISNEINKQIGNYIRGKVVQMFIVFLLCSLVFQYFALNYALLFALCLGVSVFIPYVGAVLATVLVMIAAYGQFGLGEHFGAFLLAYTFVQILDANVFVPLIFSEAVSLHPLFIIIAIIFFGGLGGVMGVFFAIPLASVIKALVLHWPVEEIK